MSHRINIVLSDTTWQRLSALPKGERSRFVDRAIDTALTVEKRRLAATRLGGLRGSLESRPGCAEDWVREDRDCHA